MFVGEMRRMLGERRGEMGGFLRGVREGEMIPGAWTSGSELCGCERWAHD